MIPIYRAKKIDSDEWVEGNLVHNMRGSYIVARFGEYRLSYPMDEYYLSSHSRNYDEIDPNTLAIQFPYWQKDMFASLNKDGVGASIVEEENDRWVWLVDGDSSLTYKALDDFGYMDNGEEISVDDGVVIGIHKGEES